MSPNWSYPIDHRPLEESGPKQPHGCRERLRAMLGSPGHPKAPTWLFKASLAQLGHAGVLKEGLGVSRLGELSGGGLGSGQTLLAAGQREPSGMGLDNAW